MIDNVHYSEKYMILMQFLFLFIYCFPTIHVQLTKLHDEWNTEGPRPLYLSFKAKFDNIQYITLFNVDTTYVLVSFNWIYL